VISVEALSWHNKYFHAQWISLCAAHTGSRGCIYVFIYMSEDWVHNGANCASKYLKECTQIKELTYIEVLLCACSFKQQQAPCETEYLKSFSELQPCVFSLSEHFINHLYQIPFNNLLYSQKSQCFLHGSIRLTEDRNLSIYPFSSMLPNVCQNSVRW